MIHPVANRIPFFVMQRGINHYPITPESFAQIGHKAFDHTCSNRSTRQWPRFPQSILVMMMLHCCGFSQAPSKAEIDAVLNLIANQCLDRACNPEQAFSTLKRGNPAQTLALLVDELDSDGRQRQRAAMFAIGQMEWENPGPALPALRNLLESVDGSTRGEAAIALACLGDEGSYKTFVDMVAQDKDENARCFAAWALGEMNQPTAIVFLESLPSDSPASVGAFVGVALERLKFVKDHLNEREAAAAKAVSRIAGSSPQQDYRIERQVRILRSLEPVSTKQMLASWGEDQTHPTISMSARRALERLDGPK